MKSPPERSPIPQSELESRLARLERSLGSDPQRADAEAAELLASCPGHPMVMLFQGIARRLAGDPAAAVEVLEPLCRDLPDAPLPRLQLGLARRSLGENDAAAAAMRRAVEIRPDFADAWYALADLSTEVDDAKSADRAFRMYVRHSAQDRAFVEPATALRANRIADADSMLRTQLEKRPNDVAALNLLAEVATRRGRLDEAQALLERCLTLAPGYTAARHNYAVVLMRQSRPAEALEEADRVLAIEPETFAARSLRAAILVRLVEYEQAIAAYESLLQEHPGQATLWASLGHVLRTVGRLDECVDAYRKAIEHAPQMGEAWWNLANLKTVDISDTDLASMRAQVDAPGLEVDDRIHFHFAIGKGTEDRGDYAESFRHYAEGNRLRRERIRYSADDISAHVSRSKALFDQAFFERRAGGGDEAADAIFVIGLPRAGSTLVEQILASHSLIEGTMELPHVMGIAKSLLDRQATPDAARYPEVLASLTDGEFRALARSYLERIGSQRKHGAPYFVDKMPNNFMHVGLIHLMLPNARIVDVRRHPLACGWSLFRHLFASGQHFSYSLEEIGRYYRDYVELMAHFDAVLPGRVHRVVYESLVDDAESEIRGLLDYCGVPFEASCLEFHRTERAVSTPSSEQVRSPLFRTGLDHWRHFEPWLGPMKRELDDVLGHWRGPASPS